MISVFWWLGAKRLSIGYCLLSIGCCSCFLLAVVYWLLLVVHWLLSVVYCLLSIGYCLLAIVYCRSPCSCSSRARAGIGPCRSPCTSPPGARARSSPCRSPCTAPSGARARTASVVVHVVPFADPPCTYCCKTRSSSCFWLHCWLRLCTCTQQGRARSRRLHTGEAARPPPMRRVAYAVESKAVVRTEVAVSPRPCLGCAVELVLRVAPLRRGVPPR
jgi:hypothetical protein